MKKLLGWLKLLFNAAEQFRSQQAKVETLQERIQHLTELNKLFVQELRHQREVGSLEREKLKLELMNELLHRLPPPSPPLPPPPPQP